MNDVNGRLLNFVGARQAVIISRLWAPVIVEHNGDALLFCAIQYICPQHRLGNMHTSKSPVKEMVDFVQQVFGEDTPSNVRWG